MNRSTRSRLQPKRRTTFLTVETLESRRLLASDLIGHPQSADVFFEHPNDSTSAMFATSVNANRATDSNFGSINGNKVVTGILGKSDKFDLVKFTIRRKAQVQLKLSQLQSNADLFLIDSSNKLIAHSTQSGRRIDRIGESLDAGTYSVFVLARTTETNSYRLSVAAHLVAPSTTTKPVQPNELGLTKPAPVNRLPDVANFGGSREWGLNAIGAPEAWARGYTGQGVTVAVVDTGVDLDHRDLVHSIYVNPGEVAGNGIDDDRNGYIDDVHGYDFVDRDAVANDTHGHGTHVAGIVAAANNGVGATGVAPGATIIPVRVLGNGTGQASDVAAGIRYAAKLGADIINLSLGGGYSSAIGSAIDYARSLGSIIVAAAGNAGASVPGYPARFSATDSNVISVGAYSSGGTKAGFSNLVGVSGAIQIDAPGVGIFSTYRDGRYATMSGTSMAAPHVAGLAALTLSANRNLTAAQLRRLLAATTDGSAGNSDSIGKASSHVTVAYAAAGITVSASATQSQGLSASSRSSPIGARFVSGAKSNASYSSENQSNIVAMVAAAPGTIIERFDYARSSQRVADFTAPAEPRNSPVDLYFEDFASEASRHFDTQMPPGVQDFA